MRLAVASFPVMTDNGKQYGEIMYNIPKPSDDDAKNGDDDEELDIEASIQKELAAMKAPREKPQNKGHFMPIDTSIECVFFMKTTKPVEPDALIRRICEDAKACPDPRERKCKYINRMTPVFNTDKATENGIERVARRVLSPYFDLVPESEGDASEAVSDTAVVTQSSNSSGEPFTVSRIAV